MRQFSYKQCDKAVEKLDKFNKVLSKYSSNSNFHSKYSVSNNSNKQNNFDCHFIPTYTPKNLQKKDQSSSYLSAHQNLDKRNNIQRSEKKFNLQQFNSNMHRQALRETSTKIQEKMKKQLFRQNTHDEKDFSIKKDQYSLQQKQNQQSSLSFKHQKYLIRQKSIDQIDNQINSIMSKYKKSKENEITKSRSFSGLNLRKINQKEQMFVHQQNSLINQQEQSQKIKKNYHSFQQNNKIKAKFCQSKVVKKERSLNNLDEKFKHQFFQKQIKVINEKIKKVQEKKKKLKIQFLPFNYQSTKKQSNQEISLEKHTKFHEILQNYHNTFQKCQNYQTVNNEIEKSKTNQFSTISFHQSESQSNNTDKATDSLELLEIKQQQKNIFNQIKYQSGNSNLKKIHLTDFKQNQSSKNQQKLNKDLKFNEINRIVSGMKQSCILDEKDNLQRKIEGQKSVSKSRTQKKLNKSVILVKENKVNQLQKLLVAFHKQIQLDQQFRNQKIIFQCVQDQQKWNYLFTQLKKNQIFINHQIMKEVFTCTINQHNPFLKFRKNQVYQTKKINKNSVNNLILRFRQTQSFWNFNFCNKFSQKSLYECRLNQYSLDLEGKNHIIVQDLVRFVNMSLNTEFRNRDLILIFNRFLGKTQKQLKFKRFMEIISEKEKSSN